MSNRCCIFWVAYENIGGRGNARANTWTVVRILSVLEVGVMFYIIFYPIKPDAGSFISQVALTYLQNEFVLKQ